MIWHTDTPPSNDVYYRILIRGDGTWHVCCVQSFDECDYDQSMWLNDGGAPIWFETEDEAERFRAQRDPNRVRRNVRYM